MTRPWPDHVSPGNDNAVAEDELHAYVDGQLDGPRRVAVECYLASHPDDAERLAAYRGQNIGLHALLDPSPEKRHRDEVLPPRLRALADALQTRLDERVEDRMTAFWSPHRWRSLAASVALLAAAGTAGWIAIEEAPWGGNALVAVTQQATETPLHTAAASTGGMSQPSGHQVVTWLAELPGNVPATVPDLEALGFHLTKEHMLPAAGGAPAAQLLYQDDSGQYVTLTLRAGGKEGRMSFTFTRDGKGSRFVWQDAHIAYSLVGSLAQEKLLEIAEAVSESLSEAAQAAPPAAPAQAPKAVVPAAPLDPAAPTGSAPLLDKGPLIPVPLPEPSEAKET